ncbi:MAG: thiamine pyrophosphate-dependent enzyme, partial [Opitutae bacterium]
MKNLNFATNWNSDLIESQYSIWLNDPESLDSDWRAFFEGFDLGQTTPLLEVSGDIIPSSSEDSRTQACFTGAIYAFRSLGHTQAKIDPLAKEVPTNPRLSLERLGFAKSDLGRIYDTGNYLGGRKMTVSDLLSSLQRTYCGSIGVEYLHIQATNKRRWLQARMEPTFNQHDFTQAEKTRVLRKVREAELFEQFLHTHYVGQKRFSLEGGETLIPCLDSIVQNCPALGVDEIVMGMAHRGRLNVLANILEKSYAFIFEEFSDNYYRGAIHGDGDVKYHLGFNNFTKTVSGEEVEVRLAANPSHLEAVDPVVQGKTRARQRLRGDLDRKKVVPVLVHGDAAIAGQGIVAEVFNFSQLKGYHTGGTIHVVVNNQIGFTTNPEDSRS